MTEEKLAEYNRKALVAWNAWKDVCWVDGIGKPLRMPDGETTPPVGTLEDADLLRGEIGRAFRRKIFPFRTQLEFISSPTPEGRRKGRAPGDACVLDTLDFARVFDNSLFEYEHSEQSGFERYDKHFYGDHKHVRKAKCWKNVVWAEIVESDDEPLKVIRGRLIGPLGVMNQVVEEWLMSEYCCWEERDPATGKSCFRFADSADAKTSDALERKVEKTRGQETLEGSARQSEIGSVDDASAGALASVDDGDCVRSENACVTLPVQWAHALDVALDGRQTCLLLAFLLDVKFYNDREILTALGIGKSAALEAQKRVVGNLRKIMLKMGSEAYDALNDDESVRRGVVQWIKNRARAEKAGRLILLRVEADVSPAK